MMKLPLHAATTATKGGRKRRWPAPGSQLLLGAQEGWKGGRWEEKAHNIGLLYKLNWCWKWALAAFKTQQSCQVQSVTLWGINPKDGIH